MKIKSSKPTNAELEILEVLWQKETATVREVFEDIAAHKETTYTTVLKFLQIMQEKGFVARETSDKAHVYRPVITEREAKTSLVSDLLEKAFRGSALSLVQHVLETKAAKPEELAELRRMISEAVDEEGEAK
jgi:BlaI family penicillinase repressor